VEHAVTKQQASMERIGESWSQEGREGPRLIGPGRLASPLFKPPGARLPQVSHSPSPLFVFLSSKSKTSKDIASHFEFCFIHKNSS
jgi:hypothetical protein